VPDLPTLAETIPGLHANAWYGLFVPAGTPKEIVGKLRGEIATLMDEPGMKERLVGLGVAAASGSPEQLAALVRDDLVRWARIVKDSGAQLD
jgi:tripartite-type tricarboxylate transporter receptor subunit TctC